MFRRQQPMVVLRRGTKRDIGRKAQLANVAAARTVASILRSTLGPRGMYKMLLDPMGTVVLTSDGNAILREVDVTHPAANSIIELSRAQGESVGDGTTTVVVLAGTILAEVPPLMEQEIHPTLIVSGLLKALEYATKITNEIAQKIPVDDDAIAKIIGGGMQSAAYMAMQELLPQLAIKAARIVITKNQAGELSLDTKRFVQILRIPGGDYQDSEVLTGVLLNKDVTHGKMSRRIDNPRVVLLDCPLEYKKAESATNVEIMEEGDWEKLLAQEEIEVRRMCDAISATQCNVCITEKGVSDLAQHYLMKAGISVIRRVRKTDNDRLSRVTGAVICSRPEELTKKEVGCDAGLFQVQTIGDEYYAFVTKAKNQKACTILLRGSSKEVLADIERKLQHALAVARNLIVDPYVVAGGGAFELELAKRLTDRVNEVDTSIAPAYKLLARALAVIPQTLIANCGGNPVKSICKLQGIHNQENGSTWGIDGTTGEVTDMKMLNIWDSRKTKLHALTTATEAAAMIIRIDDIISGISKKDTKYAGIDDGDGPDMGTFGDARDG